MRKFTDYAEKAISRYGLSGYNNLAREIGVTKCVMSQFRNEKATPSEETFLKIVELSGMPKEEALIDLNLWRSKDKPEVQKIWQRLSKMIGCFAATLLFSNNLLIFYSYLKLIYNVSYVYKRNQKSSNLALNY